MSEIKIDFTYWENIFCHHTYNKYLITVIYIAFTKLSTNKKQPCHKLGRRNGKNILKEDTQIALCQKFIFITYFQGSANDNDNAIYQHTSETAKHQKEGKLLKKMEPSPTFGANIFWYSF